MAKDFSKTIKIFEIIPKISVYLLVFLLPIFFLPWTANALDFNKQALLIILVFVALFSWILSILVSGKFTFNLQPLYIPIGILFLVYLFSTIFSLWRYGSFWGWPQLTDNSLLTLLCFILFYFLVANIFTKKEIFYLMIILVFAGFLVMLLGVLQLLGKFIFPLDFTKITSFNTVGLVNNLGFFAAVLLPLIITLIIITRKLLRVFFIIIALLDTFLLVLVNFPSVWWPIIIGSVLIITFGTQKRDFFDSRWVILPMFFLALALLFSFFRFQIPGLPSRPIQVFLAQGASFDIAKEVLRERPFFGSGPGTFVYDFSKYRKININESLFWNIRLDNAGSEILNNLATLGILGLLPILVLMGLLIFFGIKFLLKGVKKTQLVPVRVTLLTVEGQKSEGFFWLLGLGVLTTFIVLSISYFLYFSNFTLGFVFFLLIGGVSSLIFSNRKEILLKPSSLITLSITFIFTLVFILGLGIFILEGQRYIAEVNYVRAIRAWQQQKSDEALSYLERAKNLNPRTDLYWRELSQAYLQKINEEATRKDLSKDQLNQRLYGLFLNTVDSAMRATNINPNNVANWAVRAFIYQNLIGISGEAEDWAIKSYDKAIELEPNNPYFPTQKGIVLLRKALFLPKEKTGEKEQILSEARQHFDKAIELKSDYAPAHFQIAMIYQALGKSEEAIKTLEETKNYSPFDTGLAFQTGLLYYQNKNYQKAQEEFERAIAIDPNYANALYFLGLTYDQQGQKTKAIEKFKKVAELNPQSEEVTKILENLKAGKKALEGIVQEVPPQTPIEEKPPERLEK